MWVDCTVRVQANPMRASETVRMSHGAMAERGLRRRGFFLRDTKVGFAPLQAHHCFREQPPDGGRSTAFEARKSRASRHADQRRRVARRSRRNGCRRPARRSLAGERRVDGRPFTLRLRVRRKRNVRRSSRRHNVDVLSRRCHHVDGCGMAALDDHCFHLVAGSARPRGRRPHRPDAAARRLASDDGSSTMDACARLACRQNRCRQRRRHELHGAGERFRIAICGRCVRRWEAFTQNCGGSPLTPRARSTSASADGSRRRGAHSTLTRAKFARRATTEVHR